MDRQPEMSSTIFEVPAVIDAALRDGADMAWSLSGGKDSQALVIVGAAWFRAQGYPGRQYVIHADLGRAEWPQTPAFVQQIAEQAGVPLIITRRTGGDLIQRIEQEIERLAGTNRQVWPSSGARYCTSDLKRGPLNRAQRTLSEVVICAQGNRFQESPGRAKQPVVEVDKGITATSIEPAKNLKGMPPDEALAARQPGQRLALNWHAIASYTIDQVWEACGTSTADLQLRRALYQAGQHEEALEGWPCHPAYVFGNERLSCAFCVLGSKGDLLNGAQHNPELYAHLIKLEIVGGATFKNKWSLTELPVTGRAAQLRDETLAAYGDQEFRQAA
jgi:3'-phosphoadenosine 5'-phosphosulfate sulfotransferase (PAPS reductase)/FAD synthetase